MQAQILDLLLHLQKEEHMSLLIITHDLGVVARLCQRVMVMYAGQLVETGPVNQVFHSPQHPYTRALLESRRSLNRPSNEPLIALEGNPPRMQEKKIGCAFAPRCPSAMQICAKKAPPYEHSLQGSVHCWLPEAKQRKATLEVVP